MVSFFLSTKLSKRFLKKPKISDKAVEVGPWLLMYVPDYFKKQNMCEKAVKDDSFFYSFYLITLKHKNVRWSDWGMPMLIGVYTWLVCDKGGVYMWYDDVDYYDQDNCF